MVQRHLLAGAVGLLDDRVGRRECPLQPQLGLQQTLGVLLQVEVDGQLDVHPVDGVPAADLADDAAVRVDLVDDLAPLAVQRGLVLELDTGAADILAAVRRVVAEGDVVGGVLFRDRPHVADDVGGERRIRVHPSVRLDHRDAGEVLAAFAEGDDDVLGDVLGDRQRTQCREVAGVEPRLHLLDGDADPAGQAAEQGGAVGGAAHRHPVDGDVVDRLVAGEEPAVVVEDLPPLGGDQHGPRVALVDDLLQRLRLDSLQEPQPGAEPGEQHHGNRSEHAEPGRSLVRRHYYSLVTVVERGCEACPSVTPGPLLSSSRSSSP